MGLLGSSPSSPPTLWPTEAYCWMAVAVMGVRTVFGTGLVLGVGVGGGMRTTVGVGVGLIALSSVSASAMVSGVSLPEPPQAVMPARTKRDRRVRANCRDIALFRPVQGVEGQDDGRDGFGGCCRL